MPFAEIIQHNADSPGSRDNLIHDALLSFAWRDVPAAMDSIGRYLDASGIQADGCLAVECGNSVPGALLLLTLLHRGQGFVLLPPQENPDKAALKPVPDFCRHRLHLQALQKDNLDNWVARPECFLKIEAHAAWAPSAGVDTRGKLLVRTSGSMGKAKIVVHDQNRLLDNAGNCRDRYHFNAADRVVIPVPIFHMYGFGAGFLPAVLVGAAMDLQANSNLLRYLDRERRFQPTIAFMTPNLVEMLMLGWKTPREHYRVIVSSGQRLKDEVFRAIDPLCGHHLVNQYGSTEMGAMAVCDLDAPQEVRINRIGRPMNGVELRVEPVEGASHGKIYCRHPYCYLGYVDESGDWLLRDEDWYFTGDIARVDDGGIEVLGRADNSLNRSGYLVLPGDIEKGMEQLDYLAEVAVLASESQNIQGQRIVAFCVLRQGQSVVPERIRSDAARFLPHYALPDEVIMTSDLPLLPSGKLDRQTLLKRLN